MSAIWMAIALGMPLAACILSRMDMFKAYAGKAMTGHEARALLMPGAGLDMLVVLVPLVAASGVIHIVPFQMARYVIACLAALICSSVFLLTLADAFIYRASHGRISADIVKEMRVRNIVVAMASAHTIAIPAILVPFCVHVYAVIAVTSALSGISFLIASCVLCFAAYRFGRTQSLNTDDYIQSCGIAESEYVRGLVREKILCIQKSAVANFLSAVSLYRKAKKELPKQYAAYSATDEQCLKDFGMTGEAHYVQGHAEQKLYKRIVLVCLESLSQKMLPFYNNAMPSELMSFFNTLLTAYPRLDRMYTSNAPTNEGLYALHASRLSYEYDLAHGQGRIDSLPALLKEKGLRSYALSGVTRHYGNKPIFFKNLLRYDNYLAEEDIRQLVPSAPKCGWGIADVSLYEAGLHILEQNRDFPILLTIETANTHPRFFYSLKESIFPAYIQNSRSRLMRTLYELDLDLRSFFRELKKRGLFDDDTLIVITADHSPTHGAEYLHATSAESYAPDLVPCVFVSQNPDKSPFSRLQRDALCSQLDFLPTLIDGLGLRRSDTITGHSLFSGRPRSAVSKTLQTLRIKNDAADLLVSLDQRPGSPFEHCFAKWYTNTLLRPYMR